METTFVESQILAQTYNEVRTRFMDSDDLAHGWEHIDRVYKLAHFIAGREKADGFVVGMAALLHDLGRVRNKVDEEEDTHIHHADLSMRLASELLDRYQVAAAKREAILHAIIAHSFSKGVEPRTIEARVVRDADRLDGLGAIGVLRWAVTGTMRRTPATRSYHPEDPFAEWHTPDDTRYMLDHFYTKLLKLVNTMSTETGRKLAHKRTTFMRTFLDEFQSELEAVE